MARRGGRRSWRGLFRREGAGLIPGESGKSKRRPFGARTLAGLISIFLGVSVYLAPPALAFIFFQPSPSMPDTVVGQTAAGALGILSTITAPESATIGSIKGAQIDLYPSCDTSTVDCGPGPGAFAEAGVYDLAPGPATNGTGTGASTPPGNATCTGTWSLVPDNPNPALAKRWRFVPPGGEATLILTSGEVCAISFTFVTLRVPTVDVDAGTPGTQTFHATGATPIPRNLAGVDQPAQSRQGLATQSSVAPVTPGLSTEASSTPAQNPPGTPPPPLVAGATTTDVAHLTPPPPPSSGSGAPPGGSITFNLYGPADPTCAAAPIFTQTVAVNGFADYTTSAAPITAPGTYRWRASYSGDPNYLAVPLTPCGDPTETVAFAAAATQIVTMATPTITLGGTVQDTATLSGGVPTPPAAGPTGTITFTLFNNPTCTGAPVFTSVVPVNGNGNYTSTPPFTPTAPGSYNWVAAYSGDANNAPATSACGAPNETSVVSMPTAAITTQATPTVTIGSPVQDTATVTGTPPTAPPPTGTVTFTLFNNPTCTGAPIFTSAAQPLSGGPPPTATSGPFTPTAPGSYNWVAAYSGDANYAAVTSACGAPNETSVVNQATPAIVTQATPTVTIGSPVSDTATVSGTPLTAPPPTGTVTFTLFNNPTCTGAPIFTSPNRPLSGGPPPSATSAPFTPTAPGSYNWVAAYSGDANYPAITSACGAPNETSVVNQSTATIATQATPTVTVGSPVQDTATVTGGPAPAPTPTGTVTFTLFNNATCTGAPIFTSAAQPLGGGPPPTATSGPFTPTAPGSYNWVAAYSGDANYPAVTSACAAPNETSVVNQATAVITTSATPTATIGSPISDTATVTGTPATAPAPTGTVTFTLFGPGNPTCTGAPIFTSANRPLGGGPPPTATSDPFTPTAPGTYNWVAAYSGDANYPAVTSACGAANESSVVNQAVAVITTQATPTVTIGSPISDTATVTGAAAPAPTPTGTVTFTLFGPGNPTCTGAPIFTSAARPLGGGPPPTATSAPFTPTAPGSYNWVAAYSGDANYPAVTSACGAPNETSVVNQSTATIVTQATPTVTIGSPISDTATVTGAAAPAPTPTGTVTFTLFGPGNPTCTGAPIFTSAARPLGGGPPPTATSAPFTPTAPGSYNWVAAYSGDANYPAVTSACGAPNETSVVNQSTATIVTQATPTVTIGSPVSDTATVTGGAAPAPAPTGTVTFTLFGPGNPTCTGAPIFTSAARPLGGGPPPTATSAPFTPTAPGSYNWVAAYSGDANYPAVTSACGAPNETSVVNQSTATIVTQATPTVTIGSPVSDTATVTGGPAPAPTPTGTVTFTLFGPGNPTCTGAPIFTSAARPLGGGPPPTATSAPFTPTAPGSYNWVAAYSGDANYPAVTSACGAPNETSVVSQATAVITTSATPTATIGSPISDTATVTGTPPTAPAPTGTVTFTLFGPANPTCTGAPIFTSPNKPLSGGPPPTATSDPFTPTAPGSYNWVAAYSGDANYPAVTSACGAANESSVVNQSTATIATQATPTVTIGSPISDTATVTGGAAPAPTPTGTVTFTLFNNPTCTGAPIFTSAARPLGGGPPPTATSAPFTPTAPGSYNWVAAYSGDANYPGVTSACAAPNETSVVNQSTATIVTQATPTVTIGSPVSDTATVTGGAAPAPAPTGTVTFTLFNNPTCTGAPIFTSAARPLGGGPPPTATSTPFTPTAPGSYNWVAAYSGDANYPAVTSACAAPNETSVVNQATATIVTQATPTVSIGSPVSDTATVTGGAAPAPTPTGTVTFTLFNNATCTGAPIFTSAAQPLGGGPPPTATSGPFTPTAPGSYNWVAAYSGDANYPAVTSACAAPNETSVVGQATAVITTSATPTATIGSPISDTATVTGTPATAPAPTGTVTFTLFGPANPTCTGAPIFTSAGRPLGGGPPPTATSAAFTPAAPGTYNWVAAYSGDANYPAVTSACGAANETTVVNQATAVITTSATPTVTIGSPISDTATVTGAPAPAPAPTGTVTFTLFGPGNPTCTGAPIFTSATRPLGGGPPPTAASAPFTPTALGTYNWVAAYSGDANYPAVTSACGAPNEASVVGAATAAITTQATPTATIGSPVSDTATVTGTPATAPPPTGTVTFTLFNNPTCTGAPIFTSASRPLGGGPPPTATSAPFTPTAPGFYNWVAAYSGDANYAAVTSACAAPNETSVVAQATPAITTQATPTATIGSPISDTATVTGTPPTAPAPTGTVTFTLFGPANPTCTGAPIFTSAARPLGGGPPPTATSDPFTPTAPGSYNWVAAYSGDANYPAVTSACGAPNETSVIGQATPAVTTSATPTATIGSPVSDTATVTGTPPTAPAPTGTVTFTLFGPANPTCTGAPIFTSAARPLGGGPPPTATSAPFTPTATGTYNWVAAYSGDANYPAVTSACGAPGEASVIGTSPTQIVTQAAGPVTLSQPISDTATLSGGVPTPPAAGPTGTVTFTLFGPANPTCTGAPIFTATVPVNGNGPYQSGPFTPTAAGTYQWVAVYSGDANNAGATSACGAPNEASVVTVLPTIAIVKDATPPSRPEPGGDFTFSVVVTNTSTETLTITSLVDNVYGNLATRPTCTTAVGTVLAPGGTYSCAFTAPFTGPPGATQTDTVTVHATNPAGVDVSASDDATVAITNILPTISVDKSASPLSRPEPGGDFTYTVVVTNTTNPPEPVTITSLVDNVYGDLTTRPSSTCGTAIGTVLAPGASYTCTFTAPFTGPPGATQTDTVTATAVDQSGDQATASDNATVAITNVLPVIAVQKTADPLSRPEPGGDFTYTVVVTNNSTEPVTITSLNDDVYGDLTTRPNSTCNTAIGTVLAPGASYTCTFTAPFTGPPGATRTDTVTATAVDQSGDTAQASDNATVAITNVLPVIAVQKTADPLSRPEPGGDFTYTVVVTNNSTEPVTITSLNDNVYGDLATRGTCTTAVGTVLAPGASYTCTFTAPFTGPPGATQTDTVTATAVDQSGDTAQASDNATVAITNVLPQIIVVKDASPASRPEPGGDFTFSVQVINNGPEPVTITSLTDNVYGNLATRGTCTTAVGTVLAPGASYSCAFTAPFTGPPGATQTDTVTATAVDQSGDQVQASDNATVFITNVLPTIAVTKTPSPASRPEPGGDFTYTVVVTNTSTEPVRITSLTDNVYGNLTTRANSTCGTAIGTTLAPGATYTCTFTAPFTGPGGSSLTDTVTATAVDQSGDTTQATAQATVTLTNVAPVISVVKTASPLSRPEPGGDFTFSVVVTNTGINPVTITSLVDNVYGNLTTRANSTCTTAIGTVLAPGATYSCSFTAPFTGDAGASQTDTVTATAVDNRGTPATASASATVTITNVPPTVAVAKSASPTSRPQPGGDFTFTVVVTNTSAEPVRITSLVDNVYGNLATKGSCTTAIGTVLVPGGTYQCSFTAPFTGVGGATQTDTVTVVVVDNEGSPATASASATVVLTNVPPTVAVAKSASPTSRPQPGGTFTFTVVVTNTSNEPVTVTQLFDNVYGNLNGRGTCAIGAKLAAAPGPGNTYTCSFDGSFVADGGARQTDTVTVTVVNNQGAPATNQASATVTITSVAPTISVSKVPAPASLPAPGGTFTFTVGVTNTSNEAVQVTSLVDDVFGDLNGRGNCGVGAVLQPGATFTCTFNGDFRSAGGSQTDTVTAKAVNRAGLVATAQAQATVQVVPAPVVQQPLPRTGGNVRGPLESAAILVTLGLLMVAGTWRSPGIFALVGVPAPHRPRPPAPPTATTRWWRRRRGDDEPPPAGPVAFSGPPGGGGGRGGSGGGRPGSSGAALALPRTPPSPATLAAGMGLSAGRAPAPPSPTGLSRGSGAGLALFGSTVPKAGPPPFGGGFGR